VLDILLTIGLALSRFLRLEVRAQRADHVHVQAGDVVVVVMDVLILLLVLCLELFDSSIFLSLYLSDLHLAPPLHIFSQTRTLHLVLFLDLARDPLVLFACLGRKRIEVLFESVTVLSLSHLLLLLLNFKRTQVLLQLALVDAVLIFAVLELDLRSLLHHCLLIQVLEH